MWTAFEMLSHLKAVMILEETLVLFFHLIFREVFPWNGTLSSR